MKLKLNFSSSQLELIEECCKYHYNSNISIETLLNFVYAGIINSKLQRVKFSIKMSKNKKSKPLSLSINEVYGLRDMLVDDGMDKDMDKFTQQILMLTVTEIDTQIHNLLNNI